MIRQLLDEVKSAPLDDASRQRLKSIHEASIAELKNGLAPELVEELERITLPFTDEATPTDAELRIAQAQLVGWLEGLFHGIQTALFAQQMAARAQLEQMRRALPPGTGGRWCRTGHRVRAPKACTCRALLPRSEVREFSGEVLIFPGTGRPGFPSHARPIQRRSPPRLGDILMPNPTPAAPARVRARCVELASVFQSPLLEEPLGSAAPTAVRRRHAELIGQAAGRLSRLPADRGLPVRRGRRARRRRVRRRHHTRAADADPAPAADHRRARGLRHPGRGDRAAPPGRPR